ncbi:MAG: PKD domain-containing protein [Saprospiraceae bacterium]|nr:PKD domain-containing protein [Saprospiraceae bacterium]
MKNPAFFFFLIVPFLLFSQNKYDYNWTLGAGVINIHLGYTFGGTMLNFNRYPVETSLHSFATEDPYATISDKNGNLVAFTDGCLIANRNHELMLNGDSLNPGRTYNSYCSPPPFFYPGLQTNTFVPKPGDDSLYYLFHVRNDDKYRMPMDLFYSEIDVRGDNGNGEVTKKNQPLVSDSLYMGAFVNACRHANGRDWWITVTRRFHSEMHVTLVTPDTIQYMGMRETGFVEVDSGFCCNQTRFTPDGSRYFRNYPGGMLILDFDRCTGTFSNPVYWDYLNGWPNASGGIAFSPSGRFLYIGHGLDIQQYDLWAPDILSSRTIVAEYDGYVAIDPTYFFHAQLAADGKIYLLTTSNNDVLHIIHYPERKGLACQVEQHGLKLRAMGSYFEPNFPNYRLGPVDGSECDTLDIDNLPAANFRWDLEDTLLPLTVTFTDLSSYEPASWHWDFGDPASGMANMSQDTSPVHLFTAAGTYEICLTICNDFACDTLCREVTVELPKVNSSDIEQGMGMRIYPNPAGDILHIQSIDFPVEFFEIYDAQGRVVFSGTLAGNHATVEMSRFPPGGYYLRGKAGAQVWQGKFVKGW